MGQDCKYCGAYISGREESCPACGKKVKSSGGYSAAAAAESQSEYRGAGTGEKTYTYNNEYETRYNNSCAGESAGKPFVPVGSNTGRENAKAEQTIAYLCYLGPLFLIPYLLRRDSEFIRFHSNQGLLLLLVEVIVGACEMIPIIGWLIDLVGSIFVLICFVKGLINVNKGLEERLPIIGEIEILK